MDEQEIIRRYAEKGWLKLRDDEAVDAFVAEFGATHSEEVECEQD